MNKAQNDVSKVIKEQHLQDKLKASMALNYQREHDGLHKWVKIKPSLSLLCRIDEHGNLLPKELERIKKVKRTLGIN